MRSIVYGIAALVSLGIMIAIATAPIGSDQNDGYVLPQPGTLVMNVPEMHCEFSCFPKVKETLENTTAVDSVELAEQKEEGTIDNRQVVINYKAGFDVDAAIRLLESNNFANSSVVQ